jgi:hypothetical protein
MTPADIAVMWGTLTTAEVGKWAAWAAWTAVGVNALGLVFLGYQLRLNRIAIAEASKATHVAALQARPWVEVFHSGVSAVTLTHADGVTRVAFKIPLKVRNVGRTPALDCCVTAGLVLNSTKAAIENEVEKQQGQIKPGHTVFPEREYQFGLSLDELTGPNNQVWDLLIIGWYRLPGDNHYRRTPVWCSVSLGKPELLDSSLYPNMNGSHRYEANVSILSFEGLIPT